MYEWLACLLRVLLLMWMGFFDMFHWFHFLEATKEVEFMVAWVDLKVGGVTDLYQSVVVLSLGEGARSCMHVSCVCVSYTCIPCACLIASC